MEFALGASEVPGDAVVVLSDFASIRADDDIFWLGIETLFVAAAATGGTLVMLAGPVGVIDVKDEGCRSMTVNALPVVIPISTTGSSFAPDTSLGGKPALSCMLRETSGRQARHSECRTMPNILSCFALVVVIEVTL